MMKNRFYKNWPATSIRYRNLINYGYEPEMSLIGCFRDPSKNTCIDIGAHLGNWTYRLKKHFDKVIAFEPNPVLADLLKRSMLGKGVSVMNKALSSTSNDHMKLTLPIIDGMPRFGNGTLEPVTEAADEPVIEIPVASTTLDSYGFDAVGLIKIDVEGHELDVINGATETIRKSRPWMIIEVNPGSKKNFYALIDALRPFGYAICHHSKGLDQEISEYLDGASENYVFKPI